MSCSVKSERKYSQVWCTSYFWSLGSFQKFTSPLFQIELHLLSTALPRGFQWSYGGMEGIVNVTAYNTKPIFTGVGHDSNFPISICFASLSLGGFPKMHYPNDNEETKGYGCNQIESHNNKTYQSNYHLRPHNSYDELCCSDYPSSKMNKSYFWGRKNVFYLPYVNFYLISLNV